MFPRKGQYSNNDYIWVFFSSKSKYYKVSRNIFIYWFKAVILSSLDGMLQIALKPFVRGKGRWVFSHQSFWHTEVAAASEPVAVKGKSTITKTPGPNRWSPVPRLTPHPSESWALPPTARTLLIMGWFAHVCASSLSILPYWQTFAATFLHLWD